MPIAVRGLLDIAFPTSSPSEIIISPFWTREFDTDIYIADITLSSPDYLKTALANDMVGTNITQKTSQIAQENNANNNFSVLNKAGAKGK
mgnify:CR=1 FL=1